MLYGENKNRTMCRSILPSTRRRTARMEIAAAKRNSRRKVRENLRAINNCSDAWDCEKDYLAYPDKKIKEAVFDRRGADKLSHFESWATKVAAHLDEPDAKQCYIRSILPNGLVGWHAMTHIEQLDGFRIDLYKYGFFRFRNKIEAPQLITATNLEIVLRRGLNHDLNENLRKVHVTRTRVTRYETVYKPVSTQYYGITMQDGQEAKTTYMRAESVPVEWEVIGPTEPPQLWHFGQIEKFVADIFANKKINYEWFRCVTDFLTERQI